MTTVATAAVVCRTWLSLRLPTPNIFRFDFGCDWRIRILFLFVSTDRNYLVILSSFFCLFCSLNRLITACQRGLYGSQSYCSSTEKDELKGADWKKLSPACFKLWEVEAAWDGNWVGWAGKRRLGEGQPKTAGTVSGEREDGSKLAGREKREVGRRQNMDKIFLVRFRTNLLPTTDSSAVQGVRQVVNLLLSR